MAVTDREGRNISFFVDYTEHYSIVTEDFSPIEDPSLSASEIGRYVDKGFLVRPDTDGNIYGITLYHYLKNGKSLTGLHPQPFYALANQWIECRYVKIYRGNVGTYRSIAPNIEIGITV
jgi:hypothetical protein